MTLDTYVSGGETANTLIAKYGVKVGLESNISNGGRGISRASVTFSSTDIIGVFTGFKADEIDGSSIKIGDVKFLTNRDIEIVDTMKIRRTINGVDTVYTIVSKPNNVIPADYTIMYILQLRAV